MFIRGKFGVVLLALFAAWSGNCLRADDKPTEVESLKKELAAARKKIAELEKHADALRASLHEKDRLLTQARRAAEFAELNALLARVRAENEAAHSEMLRLMLKAKPSRVPEHPELPRMIPPPLTLFLRGKVLDVAGDLLTIDIGIDTGLTVGRELELDRGDGTKTIGTVKVTDPFNLYPKQAVVRFYPSRKVALRELKPDELPKKGDRVRSGTRKD